MAHLVERGAPEKNCLLPRGVRCSRGASPGYSPGGAGEPLSGLTRGLFVARGVRSRTGVLARGVAGLLGVDDSLVLSSSLSL